MALNRLNQTQVVGDGQYTFETLKTQLSELESRTRVPAKLVYNTYTQWNGGEENTNTDYNSILDKITIAEGQTSATFVSYIIDTGGFSNVKYNNLEIVETSGAENGSTQYETRTADTEEGIAAATWNLVGASPANKINSTNGRYIQFKISMTKGTNAPVVTSVSIVVYGAAATQEVYDARGGYKTLTMRFESANDMARLEYVATEGQTTFALPEGYVAVGSGLRIMIYIGGALQKYGALNAYTFSETGTSIIFNEGLYEDDAVTIIAYKTGSSSPYLTLENLLAEKANLDSPTFTGTVSGIDKTMVGLSNVDNTSDLDKPISNAVSAAISTEISLRTSADTAFSTQISTMKSILCGSGTFVGNRQIETATVTVTTVTNGSINVIVTALGMTGSPITVPVTTTASESADTVASNIRTALNNNANIAAFFTVSGSNNLVVLIANAVHDITDTESMNINIVGGNGVNAAPTSANSITSLTVTFPTPMANTDYTACILPTSLPYEPASMGEIYIIKSTTGMEVFNTGSGTPTFDYTVFY